MSDLRYLYGFTMSQSFHAQRERARGRILEIGDEIDAITQLAEDEERDITAEDTAKIQKLNTEFDEQREKVTELDKMIEVKNRIAAGKLQYEEAKAEPVRQDAPEQSRALVPARLKNVKSKYFASTADCYASGMWIAATFTGNQHAKRWLRESAPAEFRQQSDHTTETPELGGNTVPTPLAATIIELLERFGVYRQFSRNVTMTSETLDIPRLDESLSVAYPGEGNPLPQSDLSIGQISMKAVKYTQLAILSTELQESSVISFTDLLVRDMARNFAHHEDMNSFLGDGSPTYGGMTGIANALGTAARVTATGGWDSVTLSNYLDALGRLQEYPGLMPRWYINRYGYYASMMELLSEAGGTDMRQIEAGGELMFYGEPVTLTQVLPRESVSNGDLLAVVGDLDLGSYLGTARQVNMRILNELYAASDQLGVIGTLRSISTISDPGDASAAGCIVGIYAGAGA